MLQGIQTRSRALQQQHVQQQQHGMTLPMHVMSAEDSDDEEEALLAAYNAQMAADPCNRPQSKLPTGKHTCAAHEQVVACDLVVPDFLKWIDDEWQSLGPSELCVFKDIYTGVQRLVVWSLVGVKPLLANFTISQYHDAFLVQMQWKRHPIVMWHTLDANWVLRVPAHPTAYGSIQSTFVPEWTRVASLCAVRFEASQEGAMHAYSLVNVLSQSAEAARQRQAVQRAATFETPVTVLNQSDPNLKSVWSLPKDGQTMPTPAQLAAAGFVYAPAIHSQSNRSFPHRLQCCYCQGVVEDFPSALASLPSNATRDPLKAMHRHLTRVKCPFAWS